jgi:hypothetical protein
VSVTTESDVFADPVSPAVETTTASGRANETFAFHSGFGSDTLVGFRAKGLSHDIVQLDASMFAPASTAASLINGASISGANTTLTDLAGDAIAFSSVNKATLLANQGDLKLI